MFKNILNYIQNHFFLRNVTVAVCLAIILIYIVSVVLKIYTRHGQNYTVPDFVGMTVKEATPLLEEANLKIEVIDSLFVSGRKPGEILDQSPDAEMKVKSGRNIFVTINAERPRSEFVPFVTGYSLRQAKNTLETRGFTIRRLRYIDDVATNNVVEQSLNGRVISGDYQVKAELGSKIDLVVGQNPSSPLPIVPKVVGLTLREAQNRLWETGLNMGETISDGTCNKENAGSVKVWKQVPNQLERAMYGSNVTLYLTADPGRVTVGLKESDEMTKKMVAVPGSMEMD